MLKNKIDKSDFTMVWLIFLAIKTGDYDNRTTPFDDYDNTLHLLIKEEADQPLFLTFFSRHDWKVRKEICRKNLEMANSYLRDSYSLKDANFLKARYYLKKAFIDAYTAFYGEELFNFLDYEIEPLLIFMKGQNLIEYLKVGENEFKHKAIFNGATERLMIKGGLKV